MILWKQKSYRFAYRIVTSTCPVQLNGQDNQQCERHLVLASAYIYFANVKCQLHILVMKRVITCSVHLDLPIDTEAVLGAKRLTFPI